MNGLAPGYLRDFTAVSPRNYSKTSVARTVMARLPLLFRTRS